MLAPITPVPIQPRRVLPAPRRSAGRRRSSSWGLSGVDRGNHEIERR